MTHADYLCPVCGSTDRTRYARCDMPNCPDGHDQHIPHPYEPKPGLIHEGGLTWRQLILLCTVSNMLWVLILGFCWWVLR